MAAAGNRLELRSLDQRLGALEALRRRDHVLRADDEERWQGKPCGGGGHVGTIAERLKRRLDRGHGRPLDRAAEAGLDRAAIGAGAPREEAGDHGLGGDSCPESADTLGEINAAGPRCGGVGFELRVDEHEPAEAGRVADGEMLDDIAPHREAAGDDRLPALNGIEDRHHLVGHGGDRRRRRAVAAAESGEVGNDQPGDSVELSPRRHESPLPVPHRVIEGKSVEENDRHSAPRLADGDPPAIVHRRQPRFRHQARRCGGRLGHGFAAAFAAIASNRSRFFSIVWLCGS